MQHAVVGTIRLQKRLDYNPSACMTYNTSEEGTPLSELGCESFKPSLGCRRSRGQQPEPDHFDTPAIHYDLSVLVHHVWCCLRLTLPMFLCSDMQLVWAARAPHVPIAVRVAAFAYAILRPSVH